MRQVLGSSINKINNSCVLFFWSSWRSMKGLIVSKCLLSGLFDFSKVAVQLDPITALVFSWQKIEFELWPALLDEVQARFDTDVCQKTPLEASKVLLLGAICFAGINGLMDPVEM
ncbi:hypothetical protein Hanom_Chr06g00554241 [Helianthus anomalus]